MVVLGGGVDGGGLAFGRANRNASTGKRTSSTAMQSFDTSGNATFAGHVSLADSKYLKLGADADFIIYHDGATNYVQAAKQDSDIILRGNDGGKRERQAQPTGQTRIMTVS